MYISEYIYVQQFTNFDQLFGRRFKTIMITGCIVLKKIVVVICIIIIIKDNLIGTF